jgi:hypothetical protein
MLLKVLPYIGPVLSLAAGLHRNDKNSMIQQYLRERHLNYNAFSIRGQFD